MDVLLTRGILSLKEPESNSFASLKSFKPWSMLIFLSICLINIVRHFDSGWQKMAEWLRTIPIPLLGRLIFGHWVPCRTLRKHNTTSIHKMKQIITRERKTEYKISESNPILDDWHNRNCTIGYRTLHCQIERAKHHHRSLKRHVRIAEYNT